MKLTKKLLAFFLTLALIIGIVPLTIPTLQAETIKTGYIFETNVNIRKDASTSSAKLDNVSKINVTVLDSKKDIDEKINEETKKVYVWYKISYTASSGTITGYVREDLIKDIKETVLDKSFEESLKDFPSSYRDALTKLHAIYPNWKFEADKVPTTFSEAVAAQDTEYRKLVETDYNSWRSMRDKCYDWSKNKFITTDGGRYGASREVIAYYMDPRNFLNANDIYVFLKQSYDSKTQTLDGVKKLLKGTFLEGNVTDKKDEYVGKPYAGVIRYAASKSGVNAYVLAATIIQEHGTKGTSLSKGTTYKKKTVYNFFNFGASGTTSADILNNGAKYAYDNEWFTPTKSIMGGAKKYASGYIAAGQNTYYYKNYNVLNPDELWHQYAQNVTDSLSSSKKLKPAYAELYDMALTFRIPVYESLPSSVSKLPAKSDKLNNYYFASLTADGLSPSYNRYTSKYTLTTDGNATINYELPQGATYVGETSYPLSQGKNTISLKIKSQTGYSRTYTITVDASKAATLMVITNSNTLVKETDGNWYYYENGVKTNKSTIVNYSSKWFYVKDGVWDKTVNTLIKDGDNWLYIANGKWDTDFTSLFKYSGKWFYIENGQWVKKTTLVKYSDKWFYVKSGKWDSTAETLVKYNNKWFYIKSGKWAKKTLIFTYNGKRFYVKNGKVDLTFSGTVTVSKKTYKIKNGKVV